nr:tyrosine-type recombinase/integrase [Paludisphaera mucosa]
MAARWSFVYLDANGRRRTGTGSSDKAATRRILDELETKAKLVLAGVIAPEDDKAEKAARRPIAEHVEDFGLAIVAKGGTEKHAREARGAVLRLLEGAGVERLSGLDQETLQAALARLRARRSARTANYALKAVRSFLRWCDDAGRIKAAPKWLRSVKTYNEKVDVRRCRRSLTAAELARLLEVAAASPPVARGGRRGVPAYRISGVERAALYRLAACTGLRANELRTLDASAFKLDGPDPHVVVRAGYSKHRREDRQPLRAEDAAFLREWLASREGAAVVVVPADTAAMLRGDLEAAGIAAETADGVVDFHALRATYITLLLESGADPKEAQRLARHSTITLTMDKYVKKTEQSLRDALEGRKGPKEGD